MKRKDKELFF